MLRDIGHGQGKGQGRGDSYNQHGLCSVTKVAPDPHSEWKRGVQFLEGLFEGFLAGSATGEVLADPLVVIAGIDRVTVERGGHDVCQPSEHFIY